jgi:hypothetical protein
VTIALASLQLFAKTAGNDQDPASGLPLRLNAYLERYVKLSAEERKQLVNGNPVTKLLEVDETKEVSVFGAIWIAAPIARYVDLVKDIENFERGGAFKVTKRISSPPTLEDFAALRLPPKDVAELPACRVGDCVLKLGEGAIRRFNTEIDWKAKNAPAAADALMRELAWQYVTGYLEGGNERLAVLRDHSRATLVAGEFREMIEQMPELTTYIPDVKKYLQDYPRAALPGSASFLYWQETEFGLRPTIRISHVAISGDSNSTVVTSKMLYASHYFWTGLELRALLSDPSRGPGFWFVTVSRSRSDGLSGLSGSVLRQVVRREVRDGALSALRSTRRLLEEGRSRNH